jgi:hypothetical protein
MWGEKITNRYAGLQIRYARATTSPVPEREADLQAGLKGRDARHVFNSPFGELIR